MKKIVLVVLTLLVCGTSYAQSNDSLVVIFLTDPGVRPARIFADGFESGNARLDATGDDVPELIMTRDDNDSNLQGILVADPTTRETIWRVDDLGAVVNITNNMDFFFWGFADPFGDGTPLAFLVTDSDAFGVRLSDNTVVWSWKNSNFLPTIPNEIRFLGAADLTNNGRDELVIALPEERRVLVVGKED